MPTIAAVIFDMDGVLSDTEPLHCKVERTLLKQDDITVSDAELHASCGKSGRDFFSAMAEKYNYSKEKAEEWLQKKVGLFAQALDDVELSPIEGADAVVQYATEHFPCAVASSSRRDTIDTILTKIGLGDLLTVRVSAEHLPPGRGKPAPDIYLLAAEKLNVPPEQCLAIEDSTNGIAAAKAAGMMCIGYKSPGSGEQDLSQADWIIEKMADVIPILEKSRDR